MKNLKRVSKELGETMTEEACSSRCLEFFDTDNSVQELREMIERADTDGDGAITPEVRPTSVCMNSACIRWNRRGLLQHHDKEDVSIGLNRFLQGW